MKRYALMAVNDETDYCEVCGKQHLKRVMWLSERSIENELSDPFPCGTSCGAKLLGYTHTKIQTKVKNFDCEIRKKQDAYKESHPLQSKVKELINTMNSKGLMGKARFDSNEWIELNRIQSQIQADCDSQTFVIDL